MYQFRAASAYDVPWLDRAALASVLESPLEGHQAAARAQQRIRTTLSSQGGVGILAVAGWGPVGYALVTTGVDGSTDELQGYIQDWWVAPPHRGRGVGRALLARAEAWLGARGVRKVKIVVPAHQRAGLWAASRSGFQPEGLIARKSL